MDLYPTAVALAGLPPVPAREGLEGRSLEPVLRDPAAAVKAAAFSQYPRCPGFSLARDPVAWECLHVPKANISRMGCAARTSCREGTQGTSAPRLVRGRRLPAMLPNF